MSVVFHGPPPDYCATCYSDAAKCGRPVRLTALHKLPICSLCEQRLANGLIKYRPSNGTEFDIFLSRCFRCRHWIDDMDNPQPGKLSPPYSACKWGVLDRMYHGMLSYDNIGNWFDPADLDPSGCPATCKRYTPDDYGFDDRDPPAPDVPGQMTLMESVTIEGGKIVQRAEATA